VFQWVQSAPAISTQQSSPHADVSFKEYYLAFLLFKSMKCTMISNEHLSLLPAV